MAIYTIIRKWTSLLSWFYLMVQPASPQSGTVDPELIVGNVDKPVQGIGDMDLERARLAAEVYWVRARGWVRTLVRAVGVGFVLLGAFNLLVAPVVDITPLAPYRAFGIVLAYPHGGYYLGDVVVIGCGAVLAWFM